MKRKTFKGNLITTIVRGPLLVLSGLSACDPSCPKGFVFTAQMC